MKSVYWMLAEQSQDSLETLKKHLKTFKLILTTHRHHKAMVKHCRKIIDNLLSDINIEKNYIELYTQKAKEHDRTLNCK